MWESILTKICKLDEKKQQSRLGMNKKESTQVKKTASGEGGGGGVAFESF